MKIPKFRGIDMTKKYELIRIYIMLAVEFLKSSSRFHAMVFAFIVWIVKYIKKNFA